MLEDVRRGLLGIRFRYSTTFERQRAQQIVSINLALLIAWLIGMAVLVIPTFFLTGVFFALNLVFFLLLIPLIAVFVLVQRGNLDAAAWVNIGMLCSVIVPVAVTLEVVALPMLLAIPLIAAGMFLRRRGLIIVIVLLILGLGIRSYLQSQYTRTIRIEINETLPRDLALIGTTFGLSALFLYLASSNRETLINSGERDNRILSAVGGFRASLQGERDEARIFTQALEMLQTDMGYTLAQLFVQDEVGGYTRLRLAVGEGGGQAVLSQINQRLNDDPSAVGDALRLQRALIVSTTDSPLRSGHIVPPSVVSAVFPLIQRGILLGVLDVQTHSPDGFSDAERIAFGILADQIAGAVLEVRAVNELERTLREQEESILRYRAQALEIQQRSQALISTGWTRYIQGRGAEAFGFDVFGGRGGAVPIPASDLPPEIHQTLARGDVHVEEREMEQVVNVPIRYRGEVLGAMTFSVKQPLTDRQLELLRVVSTRLGVALENNRLFEQSQAQAARERKAGEIASLLITATNIETVLSLAAQSFNEALGAVYTRVYIEPTALTDQPDTRSGVLS